jgi:peptide subunit release factor 1 (eRF1)
MHSNKIPCEQRRAGGEWKAPPGAKEGDFVATENGKTSIEELRELAGFWSDRGDALSLYAQVKTPSELSHREEVISAKDKIQQALQKGKSSVDRADVERALETVTGMKGNGGRAKVIFACRGVKLWREFNVAGDFAARAEAGPAFALAPLVAQERTQKRYCIALADRNRARLLLLEGGEIAEHSEVLDEDHEKVRTTGTSKAQIYERRKEEQVRRHYQFLAEHLLHFYEHKDYDCLMVGCRDEMWPEIEAELHSVLKRILVGRFTVDPGLATAEEIREKAQAVVDQRDRIEEAGLVEKAVVGSATKGLGAIGLHDVIDALEKGEVRTLLLSAGDLPNRQSASLCEHCGHLEAKEPRKCALCGGKMRRFAPAEEAVLRHALGHGLEVRRMRWAKLPAPDEIAAWLRFRAEVNTPQALAS